MAVVDGVRQDSGTDGAEDGDGEGTSIAVLVVDDDPEIADLAQTFLERVDEELAVTVATSAPAGLEKARSGRFDAVVTDYHMPVMDGLAFLDRTASVAPATPGIVFSSDDAPEVVETAREEDVPYTHKRMGHDCFERLARTVRAAVRAHDR